MTFTVVLMLLVSKSFAQSPSPLPVTTTTISSISIPAPISDQNQMNFTSEEIEPPRALPLRSESALALSSPEIKSGGGVNATYKYGNHTGNSSHTNGTGYFLDNDEADNSKQNF